MRRLSITIAVLALTTASFTASCQAPESPSAPKAADIQIVEHEGYTAQYNGSTLQPDWVAWELTPDEVVYDGDVSRCDEFLPDPLVKGRTATTQSYSRTGYDRGHMAPAADFRWSQKVQDESFYLSNICLQDHTLNEKTWCDLEKRCRTWCKSYYKTTLWIVAGPIFGDDPELVGKDSMPVPEVFFKVVCKKYKDSYDCIGFVMPNRPCDDDWRNYAVSVDEVESLTGFDFFADIPDDLEERAESEFQLNYWK